MSAIDKACGLVKFVQGYNAENLGTIEDIPLAFRIKGDRATSNIEVQITRGFDVPGDAAAFVIEKAKEFGATTRLDHTGGIVATFRP